MILNLQSRILLTSLSTWGFQVSVLSRMTPRYFTCAGYGIVLPEREGGLRNSNFLLLVKGCFERIYPKALLLAPALYHIEDLLYGGRIVVVPESSNENDRSST